MNAKYLIGLITAGTLFLGACEFPGMGSDDEESTSSVATSSMATGSSSSVEEAKKEDLKQATDAEIAVIKKDLDAEELKEMEDLLGELSPECGAAFMLLEGEKDADPAEFMNSECFGEFKDANRPDGLSETCNTAYDEAFGSMQTNITKMTECEALDEMKEGEEPTGDQLVLLGECKKIIEEIEASSEAAQECDESIELPWGDMDDDGSDFCDMNDDGHVDEKEMKECGDYNEGDFCDFNEDGKVDQTEKEQCHQDGPSCDFNQDGHVDDTEEEQCKMFDVPECDFNGQEPTEEEEGKCMDKIMEGMCDFNEDGTVDEQEKMDCDKMMIDPMDPETQEMQ